MRIWVNYIYPRSNQLPGGRYICDLEAPRQQGDKYTAYTFDNGTAGDFSPCPCLDLELSLAKNKPGDADWHKKSLTEANASRK